MNSFLCISVIAVFLVAPSTAVNCTQNQCDPPEIHIMCRYPNPQPALECGTVLRVGLTEAEKEEIVNIHNRLRQFVAAGNETRGNPGPQPAAVNIEPMTWDDEIAEIAQRWANQCQFENTECNVVDRFIFGQNIVKIWNTQPLTTTKLFDVINIWYNNVENMDRNRVHNYEYAADTSTYATIVSAITKKIGCGRIIHQVGNLNIYYLVCNYGSTFVNNGPLYQTKNAEE